MSTQDHAAHTNPAAQPAHRPAIVIAGPTASGKSGIALQAAQEFNGVVINADSMQVYDVLRVITARPSPEDEAKAPHALYGFLNPAQACSAELWRARAEAAMNDAWDQGKLPVLVGGTGLYLKTLMEGLSPIPNIPDEIRLAARAKLEELGNLRLHNHLRKLDPIMAERLDVGNSQRLVRALEVIEATGKSLSHWQALPREGAVSANWLSFALLPPRDELYENCAKRFDLMLEQGAIHEVEALLRLNLDPALPAMKALGVPELAKYIQGQWSLDMARDKSIQTTKNYAKRQITWFRHQLANTNIADAQLSESRASTIFSKVRQYLLTIA